MIDKIKRLTAMLNQNLELIGGCSDGYCIVFRPPGMHTNGGCRCSHLPLKMTKVVYQYKLFAQGVADVAHEEASK